MNDLSRPLAPISDEAWRAIEDEAKDTLETYLAARKLVHFDGPKGWTYSAVATGRARKLEKPPWDGVEARVRLVQPLVELRTPFELEREEIDAIDRGSENPDYGPLNEAARRIALAEDRLVFEGYEAGNVKGLLSGAPRRVTAAGGDDILRAVSDALEVLREAGVGGPYALALGPRWYTDLAKIPGVGRYPLIEHVRRLIEGPIVWAPALTGGVVVSQRGEDFEMIVGRDISIGYLSHDAKKVRLYFEESVTFRSITPEAAVAIGPTAT
jgi:uncharacterized linocin/CFP29 family protein